MRALSKKLIRTNIPRSTSGVYMIRNAVKGKIFVGSAVDLKERRSKHWRLLKKGIHHNRHLQRHFNKHGRDDLVFGAIEFCPKEKVIEREQRWIDSLHPKFNVCQKAGSVAKMVESKVGQSKYQSTTATAISGTILKDNE
jgi:group I intron endonuclease